MWIKLVTFSLWLAVGASAVAWIMPWVRPAAGDAAPAGVGVASNAAVPAADWAPLLTRAPAAPEPAPPVADAARFRLVGVAGPVRPTGHGVALLSIDGQPGRAFRVGEVVDGNRVLLEVTAHTVKIGVPGSTAPLTLQAPLLPGPATGVPAGLTPPPAS